MKFIDLFAGLGGMHLGLSHLGECVFASEINKYACQVYLENFNMHPHGDIKKIKAKDVPDHDVLCAGLPCQTFSLTGSRKGFEDERGNLFLDVVRILKKKQPRYYILENVRGLEFIKGGACIKEICKQLNLIGYQTKLLRLNSADYGVPQSRSRIYFVGFNNSADFFKFRAPDPSNKKIVLEDILEESKDFHWIKPERMKRFLPHDPIRSEHTVIAGKFDEVFEARRNVYSVKGCAPTINTKADTVKILIGDKVRHLTARELLRCQGFPESFKLNVSYNQAKILVGNSVSVPVIKAIADQLRL